MNATDLRRIYQIRFEGIEEYRNQVWHILIAHFFARWIPETSRVLDLGCGTGRDVYMASYLVGEKGLVIGVDMTEEQLEVAQRHVTTQTERFGFAHPNVKFYHGYIEDLNALGIADNSIDAVISNCVINLSPNKEAVFAEIFRVL